jgi:hypothetical protein
MSTLFIEIKSFGQNLPHRRDFIDFHFSKNNKKTLKNIKRARA